ncbi:flavin reductase family protein [Ensifer adhaerens]|nr:flavin reductase family protein [Ensifer adhaerens]UAY05006.1 flavin reductase family protein [Ensifer adhaerens]UAY12426.1 flavin reductase family protein [Ensifer adhaerens]
MNRIIPDALTSAPQPAEFRRVLGQYPTGVTVITAQTAAGVRAGVTVSSFNTLSLDPPLILWSLALSAPSLEVFRHTERFAVNILGEDQGDVALQFARRAEDKFAGVETVPGWSGVPLIAGAVAHLECTVYRRDPGGDHEIYIGRVERAEAIDRTPLVYMRGAFGKFSGMVANEKK